MYPTYIVNTIVADMSGDVGINSWGIDMVLLEYSGPSTRTSSMNK